MGGWLEGRTPLRRWRAVAEASSSGGRVTRDLARLGDEVLQRRAAPRSTVGAYCAAGSGGSVSRLLVQRQPRMHSRPAPAPSTAPKIWVQPRTQFR